MTQEEKNNLIKKIDSINPDKEIGQAIYQLKEVIDKILELK